MKSGLVAGIAILALVIAGALCVSVKAQSTEEGLGPSEQPSAPMEIGQQQPGRPANAAPPAGMQGQDNAGPPPGDEVQGGGAQDGAQDEENERQQANQHGVARISMIHGEVSTQRGDSGTWSAATLNQPVVNGDKISTGAGGRAEVQLDFANILRLGSNAQATIADFTHKRIQIQLGQGLATYTIFKDGDAEPEIDTPNVAIHPAHNDGSFRIEVRPDGDTVVIVRKGEAQISTPKGITEIKQGEMATVRGSSENAQYKVDQAPERDDWDRWNSDRDRMIRGANSWGHTNRYYVGSEDLDKNGSWENVPDYGQAWVPNEPEGWAPYRDGNWVYEPYYGWTWVGYEPWGWAPYHYGRWFPYGNSWAWWPGPVGAFYRPFWSPAYVSFFGWGRGWGFGVGFGGWGGFGWLPIGPCDFFHPWWGGWGGRFGVVGFNRFGGRFGGFAPLHGGTRFSNVAHFNDPHISRGLSTVGANHFGTGRVSAVAATHEQLSGARMMTGNMPVVPSRASLSASGRAAAPSTIRNGGPQHFFGTHNTARPQSFEQQTSHLQQSMQQNHFSAITAGGRAAGSGTESHATASAGAGKPSAGTQASGRENSNLAPRDAGSRGASTENENRGGSRTFTPPNAGNTRFEGGQSERSMGPANSTSHSEASSPSRGESNRSEWKPFTAPSHSSEPAGRSGSGMESGNRGASGSYWNRTAPSSSSSYPRASSSGSYERGGSYSRPRLDMRQPIVQPRSSGGYGGYHGSPNSGSPGYGGSRGGSGGGSRSAPSSGGSRGGGSSSGGGGHSSGGSGHSSGGGGHSSGHR